MTNHTPPHPDKSPGQVGHDAVVEAGKFNAHGWEELPPKQKRLFEAMASAVRVQLIEQVRKPCLN